MITGENRASPGFLFWESLSSTGIRKSRPSNKQGETYPRERRKGKAWSVTNPADLQGKKRLLPLCRCFCGLSLQACRSLLLPHKWECHSRQNKKTTANSTSDFSWLLPLSLQYTCTCSLCVIVFFRHPKCLIVSVRVCFVVFFFMFRRRISNSRTLQQCASRDSRSSSFAVHRRHRKWAFRHFQ